MMRYLKKSTQTKVGRFTGSYNRFGKTSFLNSGIDPHHMRFTVLHRPTKYTPTLSLSFPKAKTKHLLSRISFFSRSQKSSLNQNMHRTQRQQKED